MSHVPCFKFPVAAMCSLHDCAGGEFIRNLWLLENNLAYLEQMVFYFNVI